MNFTINGKTHSHLEVAETERLLSACRKLDDLEIWASEDRGPSLCALLNSECGWLMFLRFDGDAGFSSRNKMQEQSQDIDENFILANGQLDSYPRSWTFDRAKVFDALFEFVASGQRPPNVDWHNDSEQG